MLPAASTLMRAAVVAVFGTVIASEPSFAVPERTVVHVEPPSIESRMFTLAAVLPPFVHVTVCVEPPVHVTAVFGADTEKAPETNATVIVLLVNAPPPARLSRTVQRNVFVVPA